MADAAASKAAEATHVGSTPTFPTNIWIETKQRFWRTPWAHDVYRMRFLPIADDMVAA
jgi:hypothetical protein